MGKEECQGPVKLKDDDSEKEDVEDNTNAEVRLETYCSIHLHKKII